MLFKKLTVEEAYTACLTTDQLVAAVAGVARGELSLAEAEARLMAFKVRCAAAPLGCWGGWGLALNCIPPQLCHAASALVEADTPALCWYAPSSPALDTRHQPRTPNTCTLLPP